MRRITSKLSLDDSERWEGGQHLKKVSEFPAMLFK